METTFDIQSAERIARVVRFVEGQFPPAKPLQFQPFFPAKRGGEPRLGTISETWNKGATATVTQIKADGTALSPTVTFTATNHFATVTVSSGTKKVLCAFVGDRWLLVAAECD